MTEDYSIALYLLGAFLCAAALLVAVNLWTARPITPEEQERIDAELSRFSF